MTRASDKALIELAYAASVVALVETTDRQWDEPLGDTRPAELERECYRLATEIGLKPMVKVENLATLQANWRRQLKQDRQKEIFDMGMLLVRQHAVIGYLQCHPEAPARLELCYVLDQIRQTLTRFFTLYQLKDSLAKLPDLPLPGCPDTWMTWSGDALRESVLKELGEPQK